MEASCSWSVSNQNTNKRIKILFQCIPPNHIPVRCVVLQFVNITTLRRFFHRLLSLSPSPSVSLPLALALALALSLSLSLALALSLFRQRYSNSSGLEILIYWFKIWVPWRLVKWMQSDDFGFCQGSIESWLRLKRRNMWLGGRCSSQGSQFESFISRVLFYSKIPIVLCILDELGDLIREFPKLQRTCPLERTCPSFCQKCVLLLISANL